MAIVSVNKSLLTQYLSLFANSELNWRGDKISDGIDGDQPKKRGKSEEMDCYNDM